MAMLGPVSLLTLLAAWLTLIVAGYTLMYWAVTERSLVRSHRAVRVVGLHPRDHE